MPRRNWKDRTQHKAAQREQVEREQALRELEWELRLEQLRRRREEAQAKQNPEESRTDDSEPETAA